MELVCKYKISKKSDLIFCKVALQNQLKEKKEKEFFIFSVLELGTNILKYAKKGEIWLLKEDSYYLLAALDRGEGIKNIEWALKKGTTSFKNSLGLGLYSISQHDEYELIIFSSKNGSIFLLKPVKLYKEVITFSTNYMDIAQSGDFVKLKGKYVIVGDVSGHGVKAYKSAEFVKRFLKRRLSCVIIDDIFQELHKRIKETNLRGVVLSVIEILKERVNICGVGNISICKIDKEIECFSQKGGIVGEIFHKVSKFTFNRKGKIVVFSDGIDRKIVYNISKTVKDPFMFALAANFFSDDLDDKTIVIIGEHNG